MNLVVGREWGHEKLSYTAVDTRTVSLMVDSPRWQLTFAEQA